MLTQLKLGVFDGFKAAKSLQMLLADRSEDAEARFEHVHKLGDVALFSRAHFHDKDIIILLQIFVCCFAQTHRRVKIFGSAAHGKSVL